jgi:transglutaminase-like putative cysteine protease
MNENPAEYLAANEWIDSDHVSIRSRARELTAGARTETEKAERLYHFVRDEISHSWDVQRAEINGKASDVLSGGHGICYGKSHLLAALLRAAGIPSGITYQRLTLFDEPEDGYSIHALNTVYFAGLGRWVRLDARGNKPGVDARFSLDTEYLAFPVRKTHAERDYGVNHSAPHPVIATTLQNNDNCMEMYKNGLPTELEYPI